MPRLRTAPATATAALAALLTLTACGSDTSSAESATCPGGQIRFGVEPYEDPAALEPAYRAVAEALGDELDCSVEVTIVEDYSAEVLAMENDQLELAQFGPLGLVFANRRADAQPVASFADAQGELSTYTAAIYVPQDSPITDVAGLRGQSLALSSAGSTSGDALPRKALADAGVEESELEIDYAGGHPEALLALTHGTVAAAEVNSQQLAVAVEAGEFDPSQYRAIWTSDPIPNDPITVRGNLPQEFRDAVSDALLNLPPDVVGQVGEFLDVTPPGPMVGVTTDTYAPLFELADALGLTEEDA